MLRSRALVPIAVLGLLAVGCGDDDAPADAADEIVGEVLVVGSPESATGDELALRRVTIPPGERLEPHTHPGMQIAHIVEGTLSYEVFDGTVEVHRAGQTEPELLQAPATTELDPGDSVVETPDDVHLGGNDGDEPVVLYSSTLFPEGAPASTPQDP
jgi:quercetin dioxygenase-like cupin family protein